MSIRGLPVPSIRRARIDVGPTPEEKLAGIKQCLYAGDYLQASEIYCAWKGVTSAEAAEPLKQLDRQFMATDPQPLILYAWRKGWIGVLIAVLFAASVVAWLFIDATRI